MKKFYLLSATIIIFLSCFNITLSHPKVSAGFLLPTAPPILADGVGDGPDDPPIIPPADIRG